MKKKIFIFIIILLVVIFSLITFKFFNEKNNTNIEDNWIVSISPTYLNSPANTVYIYEDSYVITNSYWQDEAGKIHKRGNLSSSFPQTLLSTIKNDEFTDADLGPWYQVILNSGEVSFLKQDSNFISEIEKLIDYDGTIWYARNDD